MGLRVVNSCNSERVKQKVGDFVNPFVMRSVEKKAVDGTFRSWSLVYTETLSVFANPKGPIKLSGVLIWFTFHGLCTLISMGLIDENGGPWNELPSGKIMGRPSIDVPTLPYLVSLPS